MTPTLAAVVIHHRHFPEVLDTVQSLLDAGVPVDSLVVIDNSEDDDTERGLRQAAAGWRVHTMPNRGYGAAANTAVALLPNADTVLVVTHEVRLDRASIDALVRALADEPGIAAAGPALIVTDHGRVWSRGGMLTPVLRLPRHIVDEVDGVAGIRDTDWLDGSCVAYRVEALAQNPFQEDFFLYFEETELHTRLREMGWRVVTTAGATASQSTAGMPSFWGCRNVVLFQRAHGTPWSRLFAPLWFTVRAILMALREGNAGEALDAIRGLIAGYRLGKARSSAERTGSRHSGRNTG